MRDGGTDDGRPNDWKTIILINENYCVGLWLIFNWKGLRRLIILMTKGMGIFLFDCSCGGKDGKYSGCHYENISENGNLRIEGYEPWDPYSELKFKHSFIMNGKFMDGMLKEHVEANGNSSLVIVCDDCSQKFSFTKESYEKLREDAMKSKL